MTYVTTFKMKIILRESTFKPYTFIEVRKLTPKSDPS